MKVSGGLMKAAAIEAKALTTEVRVAEEVAEVTRGAVKVGETGSSTAKITAQVDRAIEVTHTIPSKATPQVSIQLFYPNKYQ